jgi:hypothetical protein
VDDYSGKVGYVCRDPKAHGHATPSWYRHLSEEEAKARAAEEEAEQARAAELELAGEVRRSFVRQRIAAKGKPPAGTLRLVTELLLDDDARTGAMDDVAWYLGHDDPENIDVQDALATSLRKTSDARLPLVLLAVAAAAAEDNLAAYGSWRYSPAITLRWLNFVAGLGYSLSEAETSLVQAAHQPVDKEGTDGGRLHEPPAGN